MRLSGHTYPFRTLPLEGALDALVELGLGEVEVWLGHCRDGPAAARHAVDVRGLAVVAVSAGGFFEERLDVPERASDLALALGARVVAATTRPGLVSVLRERIASELAVAVENHSNQQNDRPAALLRAIRGVAGVGVCLDTGHALEAGVDPARFARAVGPRLAHVHLKDARRCPPLRRALPGRARRRLLRVRPVPVAPGAGSLDAASFARALERLGYAGAVSIEYEGSDPSPALGRLLASWPQTLPATS